MSLINREVTEDMAEANRQNSLKSTGPTTEEGKHNSRRNALRHGLYGDELAPWAEELDEDAADYRRFWRRYHHAFQPRDEVETLLVADLARTGWRLERLLRAETACLAHQRVKLANDHRRKLAGEGLGLQTALEQVISHQGGYSSLPESKAKYQLLVLLLETVRGEVEEEGYTELGDTCLQLIYGQHPGVVKQSLLLDYQSLKPEGKRNPAMQEHLRQEFLGKLAEEVENFQTLRECLGVKQGRLFEIERDTLLMLPEKAAKVAAGEENRLRGYLQQTLKQLMAWREKGTEKGPVEGVSGGLLTALFGTEGNPPQESVDSTADAGVQAGCSRKCPNSRAGLKPGVRGPRVRALECGGLTPPWDLATVTVTLNRLSRVPESWPQYWVEALTRRRQAAALPRRLAQVVPQDAGPHSTAGSARECTNSVAGPACGTGATPRLRCREHDRRTAIAPLQHPGAKQRRMARGMDSSSWCFGNLVLKSLFARHSPLRLRLPERLRPGG